MTITLRTFGWLALVTLFFGVCAQAVEIDQAMLAPLKAAHEAGDIKVYTKEVDEKLTTVSDQALSATDTEYLYQALALLCDAKFPEGQATQKLRREIIKIAENPRSGVDVPTRMKFLWRLTKIPAQAYEALDAVAKKKAILDIAGMVSPSWSALAREAARVRAEPDPVVAWGVQPPAGSDVPPGSDPSAISDPVLRKEYERAIEANRENARVMHERVTLMQTEKRYNESFSRWFRSLLDAGVLTEGEIRKCLQVSDAPKGIIDLVFARSE